MNSKVDLFLENAKQWQPEMKKLSTILLDCTLEEDFKWRNPCYTFQNKNVVIIGSFKDSCVLSFLKGALLEDSHQITSKPGENSQSARVIRFTSLQQIIDLEAVLKAYIFEAIEIEKNSLKIVPKKEDYLQLPEELLTKFEENSDLKIAFEKLTLGRQRAYAMFFSGAKQSKTRETRIEKNIPRILNGIGFNDCTCGHSKRPPNCDGTHKYFTKGSPKRQPL